MNTMTDTTNDHLSFADDDAPPVLKTPRSTPETALVAQYHDVCEQIEDTLQSIQALTTKLKGLKKEKARLYGIVSRIDPSLKATRPKS